MMTEYDDIVQELHDFLTQGIKSQVGVSQGPDPAESSQADASNAAGVNDAARAQDATDSDNRERALQELSQTVAACTKCVLSEERTQAVFGVGVINPLVMVIGEGPGADEDAQGKPFVGPAGQYLDAWLAALDLSRTKNVYITNVVKCRPPGNRNPQDEECIACSPYLYRQIELLQPKTILILGKVALKALLSEEGYMKDVHGRQYFVRNIPTLVTYHPSAVLRNQSLRRTVWEDLKILKTLLA